ncbi:coiled-coil domain-containing protein 125-like isoform X3 [Hoplias malabaricus]|uniref:coiled-coil domain-containing protein 125-like isoform X3 n=1 Tax=Hoplias malabaricus TaxID=27720 RepID=UPI0034626A38
MQGGGESSEDDMKEGDLGDGMAARSTSQLWSKDSSVGDSSEALQRRLQEVTEEVELLRTELEATHRHLEGKHEALRILQGQRGISEMISSFIICKRLSSSGLQWVQSLPGIIGRKAILDKATTHTKSLLQKSEERTKALEKEVNDLQWEITFNQVQFKNVEHAWGLKYDRVCVENKALSKALEEKLEQIQELRTENTSLSQQCLELLGLLSAQERRDFQKTQPPSKQGREGSALELAVYGACQCSSRVGEPCPCAKSAAASRKQVLQLKQELELQRRRKEEAYVMVDAFRIAFEQQLKRGSEKVLKLAENDRHTPRHSKPERGKQNTDSVAQRLRRFLPSTKEDKVPSDPTETLQLLLDLLSDKEEALAHQRKVSFMLARSSEELEKRLQAQLRELDLTKTDQKLKTSSSEQHKLDEDDGNKCSVSCNYDLKAYLSANMPDSIAVNVEHDEEQHSKDKGPSETGQCESQRVEEDCTLLRA